MNLPLLYEDDALVAVNKPCGLLMHRTKLSTDATALLQVLRDQLGQRVYPVHRLDRATSGLVVLGKQPEVARQLAELFLGRQVNKHYLAIVRGFLEAEGTVEYSLKRDGTGAPQAAITHYRRLATAELPVAVGRYASARYSLLSVRPETGRWRQIRRHFSHVRHPIIGDHKHGDNKHNRFFREQLGVDRLLLHAASLQFTHPVSGMELYLQAPKDTAFHRALNQLGWQDEAQEP